MTRRGAQLMPDVERKHFQAPTCFVVVQHQVDEAPRPELGDHAPRLVAPQVYAIAIARILLRGDQESAGNINRPVRGV